MIKIISYGRTTDVPAFKEPGDSSNKSRHFTVLWETQLDLSIHIQQMVTCVRKRRVNKRDGMQPLPLIRKTTRDLYLSNDQLIVAAQLLKQSRCINPGVLKPLFYAKMMILFSQPIKILLAPKQIL